MKKEYDYINPDHYKNFSIEVIDMMVSIWGLEATAVHCEMCAFKYRMRMGTKPDQPVDRDLKKVEWYLEKAKELRSNHEENWGTNGCDINVPEQEASTFTGKGVTIHHSGNGGILIDSGGNTLSVTRDFNFEKDWMLCNKDLFRWDDKLAFSQGSIYEIISHSPVDKSANLINELGESHYIVDDWYESFTFIEKA